MEKKSRRISVDIDADLHREIKTKAVKEEVNISDLVRELLIEWKNGNLQVVKITR